MKKKLLDGIAPSGDKMNRGISILIYADPGVGKTTLATTLPVGETLIINTEAGVGPLLGTGHYVFNLNRDLKQLEELYKYLRTQDHPFTYIVLDNISELQDWMLRTITAGHTKDLPEIREYGDTGVKLKEYLVLFRDLALERNFVVVFNAWEMAFEIDKTSLSVVTKAYPKLMPSKAPEICGIVDMVGHLEVYEKTGDRFIRFAGTQKILAKTQFKGVEDMEEANLPDIIKKVKEYNYAKKEEAEPVEGGIKKI